MPATILRLTAVLSIVVWIVADAAEAQAQFQYPGQAPPQYQPAPRHKKRTPRQSARRHREGGEKPLPAPPPDKRDSVVVAPDSTFNGRAYWLALSQCGGIYFKLNTLYTDVAVRARVIKPDPKANAEYTKKLNDAIKTASAYFDGAERFLITDRGLERADAVLTYDSRSRDAGNRVTTVDAALAAAKPCSALYRVCHETFPKACRESDLPLE
jgi:hypothetical protein